MWGRLNFIPPFSHPSEENSIKPFTLYGQKVPLYTNFYFQLLTKRKVRHKFFYLFKFCCCKLGLGLEQSTASPEKLSKSWPRPKLVNCRGKPVSCWPDWFVPIRLLKSDWLAEALLSSDWLAEALLSSDWLAHLLDT